ncbi:hypothetical protein, partial [Mycobacterium sp.]|uniref:hypothetical protein n=1 Tax=Mycobacterium sp. TaxID=1785 RepID=UPI003BAFE229
LIGGRDHCADSQWRLDAPVVQSVNVYMPAAQFASMLAAIFGDGLAPAAYLDRHAMCRCLLVENRSKKFPTSATPQPTMAIEVDDNEVRIIDVLTNAGLAAAPVTEVTVVPAAHIYRGRPTYTMPLLVVQFPGRPAMSIGIPDLRFSWRGTVPSHAPAHYVVGGADWLALVERFDLNSSLNSGGWFG